MLRDLVKLESGQVGADSPEVRVRRPEREPVLCSQDPDEYVYQPGALAATFQRSSDVPRRHPRWTISINPVETEQCRLKSLASFATDTGEEFSKDRAAQDNLAPIEQLRKMVALPLRAAL